MDPVSTIDIDGDSSFVLALEAQARGHRLGTIWRRIWSGATGGRTCMSAAAPNRPD
jgi:hypothetical protein